MILAAFFVVGAWYETALAASENLLKAYPGEVLRNEIVEFKPEGGHHFSLEAPQKCGGRAPVEATARGIKCQFVEAGAAQALLNVCDDQKTFCKPVSVDLLVQEQAAREPVRLIQNQLVNKEVKMALLPGFVFASPIEAKAEARQRNKPVLVMISTDWCPPCNEAKEYLLRSQFFQEATADWYRVYVDGDSLAATEWDKVVPFRYYPTFVLLNAEMKEVARYTGELRGQDFKLWAEQSLRWLDEPIALARQRVIARRDGSLMQKIKDWWQGRRSASRRVDKMRVLAYALDQGNPEMVRMILHDRSFQATELKSQVLKFEIQELEKSEKVDDKAQKILLLKQLVELSLGGEDWAENLSSLCEVDKEACRDYLINIPLRLEALESRPGLSTAERQSLMGEEFYYLATIYEDLKNESLKKRYAGHCVEAYEAMGAKSIGTALPRAAEQGRVACLELAGRFREAGEILERLVSAYPKEPTFMLRLARLYRKQKQLSKALQWVTKGEAVAYGYNWFSLALIKGDILLELKRQSEAREVVKTALNELRLDENRDSRNQRLVARLRSLQEKISH